MQICHYIQRLEATVIRVIFPQDSHFNYSCTKTEPKSLQVNSPASYSSNCHSLKFSVTRDKQNTSSNNTIIGVQRNFLIGPVLNNEYKELQLIEKDEKNTEKSKSSGKT